MNKSAKLIALVMTLALCLSLFSACGNSSGTPSGNNVPVNSDPEPSKEKGPLYRPVKVEEYDSAGKVSDTYTITYDEKGNKILQEHEADIYKDVTQYWYDENGYLTKYQSSSGGMSSVRNTFENGLLMESTTPTPAGDVVKRYKYFSSGDVNSEHTTYPPSDSKMYIREIGYIFGLVDKRLSKITSKVGDDPNLKVISEYKWTMDGGPGDRHVKEYSFTASSGTYTYKTECDEHGNITKVYDKATGALLRTMEYVKIDDPLPGAYFNSFFDPNY